MPTSEIFALVLIAVLAVVALGGGAASAFTGKLWLVPAAITRREMFVAWIVGVFVQVFTGVVLAFFFVQMYRTLTAPAKTNAPQSATSESPRPGSASAPAGH